MTDREILEAVIAEIKRRIEVHETFVSNFNQIYANAVLGVKSKIIEDTELLEFITDCMQEKSNSVVDSIVENIVDAAESLGISQKEHDRIVDELIYGKEPELVDDLPNKEEGPVSKDLEKAAIDYSNNLDNIYGSIGKQTRNAFKAGAEWQKQQDQETIELAEDHAMLAGMEKMKQQMMKDAVETSVCALLDGLNVIIEPKYLKEYRFGEKVKVKIFKEN